MGEEKIVKDRRAGGHWKKYVGYGITAFLVIAAAVFLIFIFVRQEDFDATVDRIKTAFAPIIYGVVFAYLMNPLMNFFEEHLKNFLYRHAKKITRAKRTARVISIILTLIVVFLLITVIIYMFVPELTATVSSLIEELPEQTERFMAWYNEFINDGSTISTYTADTLEKLITYLEDFVNNDLLDYATNILSFLATGIWSVFSIVYNIVIGLIVSVYILYSKETFSCQAKKILYSMFKRRRANTILRVTKQCHFKFTGSITGKIVDSAIIGILCFVGMVILDMPYKLLISIIVGVTNIIPFFGPFIGAVPTAFLILCVDPWKCLYFIIFIIILQQIDCNLLTPKIVGDTIGISAIWVLFACVVFGSLWGLIGMLLGVPLMACIYMIIKEIVEYRLQKKCLDTATDSYIGVDHVNEQEVVLIEPVDEPEKMTIDEYYRMIREERENPPEYSEELNVFRDRRKERKELKKKKKK